MSIDVKNWKQFRLGDLFPLINSKPYHAQSLEEDDDGVRYVTRTMFDNGVKCYVRKEDMFRVNPAGTISFGAENADFFYQNEPYITGNKMYYLDTRDITEKACLFLKSVLQVSFTYQFSFSEGMVPARIKDELISLPATPDGVPDWAYMDTYMSEIMQKEGVYADQLVSLTADVVSDGHVLDTSMWRAFRIEELFEIELAKGDIQPKQIDEGDVPLVSAGNEDNGVAAMINVFGDGISEIFPRGCITVSMFGKAFYQSEPFYAVSHGRVNILRPLLSFSDLAGLFIAGCFNRQFCDKFGYAAMCTRTRLQKETVTLPVTMSGDLDLSFMERYMQRQIDKVTELVNHLDMIWNEER